MAMMVMNFVTPKAGAEHDLLFNKWAFEICFLGVQVGPKQHKKCDQIHDNDDYEFGNTQSCS